MSGASVSHAFISARHAPDPLRSDQPSLTTSGVAARVPTSQPARRALAHLERDRDAVASHRAKVSEVRSECCAQRVMCHVADTVTLGVALDDLSDICVVSVRHAGE